MTVESTISKLIEVAQELRKAAIEADRSDLKWRVVEQLSDLMELRESLEEASDSNAAAAADTHFEITPDNTVVENSKDNNSSVTEEVAGEPREEGGMVVIQPSDDGETYGISQSGDDAISQASDPIPVEANDEMSKPNKETSNQESSTDTSSADFDLAEQRIRELEPRHQAILEKMNNILTEEQKVIKRSVTLEGRSAGKPAKQIQKEVMAAIQLTEKQTKLMAALRQELKEIRELIALQVDGLLSPEQKQALQKQVARESRH